MSNRKKKNEHGERARLLLACWRGRVKRKEKKHTMSTVKRPRGRVSELLSESWEGGGTRGRRRGSAGTEQPPLLLAHAALPPS